MKRSLQLFFYLSLMSAGWAVGQAQAPELVVQTGHPGNITSVTFSRDGKLLASGGSFEIKIWDVTSGLELRALGPFAGEVNSIAFSPDARLLASGADDETARVWDVASGKEIFTLKGHSQGVHSVVFSPDGKILATGS